MLQINVIRGQLPSKWVFTIQPINLNWIIRKFPHDSDYGQLSTDNGDGVLIAQFVVHQKHFSIIWLAHTAQWGM